MTTRKSCTIAMMVSLAFSADAAPAMSDNQYQSARRVLAAEYDANREACRSVPGRSIGLCMAEAHREFQIGSARLEATYMPSRSASYKARVAIANADYLVERRKCNEKLGDVKRLCVKQARAALIADKAAAYASEDASLATRAVNEKANAARKAMREEEERTEARKDAATERRDLDLRIAKEYCRTMPDDGKLACAKEAEKRFGRL